MFGKMVKDMAIKMAKSETAKFSDKSSAKSQS